MEVDVHSLLNLPKREAAAIIKSSSSLTVQEDLQQLLDVLLNPQRDLEDEETIDWCRWLIAGGTTPEEFASKVRLYDRSTSCRLVWTENFIAYRCRTCGISPFMSLCSDCFQHGNHEGHDFIMFRSETGGTCDCGEVNVIKESGCCFLHGPSQVLGSKSGTIENNQPNGTNGSEDHVKVPAELLNVANGMIPRLFLRLVQQLRSDVPACHFQSSNFIKMVKSFTDMGAAMTQVVVRAMISPQVYAGFLRPEETSQVISIDRISNILSRRAMKPLYLLKGVEGIIITPHVTFLQELLFWNIILEFPEDLMTLLLSLRCDSNYKEAFTKAFAIHYCLVPSLILNSRDPDRFCKRMTAISVQLFSIENLALMLVQKTDLLVFLIHSLSSMIQSTCSQDPCKGVDLSHEIMINNYYWPIQSDLKELLSHYSVAKIFCENNDLLSNWFQFLSQLHGMNRNVYISPQHPHIEHEDNGCVESFTAELSLCATPMWSLLSHVNSVNDELLTRNVLKATWRQIELWNKQRQEQDYSFSFHLPLYRYLATFLRQRMFFQNQSLKSIITNFFSYKDVCVVLQDLVKLQACYHQISNRMWVRNGSGVVDQASFYVDGSCANSMIDLDLFLIQLLVSDVPLDIFWESTMKEFQVYELCKKFPENLSITTQSSVVLEKEEILKMLESLFIFIAMVVTTRTYSSDDSDLVNTLEICTLLCQGDRTHSQLMDLVPGRCGADSLMQNFEIILDHVADFCPPKLKVDGTLGQGVYRPKEIVWDNLYNPIHGILRSNNRADFQSSRDRFFEHCRKTGQCPKQESTLWPPFRTPSKLAKLMPDPIQILESRYFHTLVHITLHKSLHEEKISDMTLSCVVSLLQLYFTNFRTVLQPSDLDIKNGHTKNGCSESFPFYTEDCMERNLFKKVTESNESITTLLLRLYLKHSKGKLSKSPLEELMAFEHRKNKFGDGEHYFCQLLNSILKIDSLGSKMLLEMDKVMNPVICSSSSSAITALNGTTSASAIRERKERLLKEFAMKREKFMESVKMESDNYGESLSEEFQCVICMEDGVSTEDNVFGLVTLMTVTDVLKHRRMGSNSEVEYGEASQVLYSTSSNNSDRFSVDTMLPICRNGEVQIQTCGHYIHMDCLRSYLTTLNSAESKRFKKCPPVVEKFTCPMCRQTANSFLPALSRNAVSSASTLKSSVTSQAVVRLLRNKSKSTNGNNFITKYKEAVSQFLEDLNAKLESNSPNGLGAPSSDKPIAYALVSYFQSTLEHEVCILSQPTPEQTVIQSPSHCMRPLVQAFRCEYQESSLNHDRRLVDLWEHLSGLKSTHESRTKIPLILRNTTSIMIHLILKLSSSDFSESVFKLILESVLFLNIAQICILFVLNKISSTNDSLGDLKMDRFSILRTIQETLHGTISVIASQSFEPGCSSTKIPNPNSSDDFDKNFLIFFYNKIEMFLKNCCLIKYSVYRCKWVENLSLDKMLEYLDLSKSMLNGYLSPNTANEVLLNSWMQNLKSFIESRRFDIDVADVLKFQVGPWLNPKLIELPYNYDNLFQKYSQAICSKCSQKPKNPAICLVCGAFICLLEDCCEDERGFWEGFMHTKSCSSGNGIFLCLQSSNILIVGRKQACYWGSVYLDTFGEEDLGLLRGKPLFLCQERYAFLLKEWTCYSFQKTYRKWFNHCNHI